MEVSRYMKTRGRIQRLEDAKFFSGWVKEISETEVWLRTNGELAVKPGETFVAQFFGKGFSAIMKLKLTVSMGNLYGFVLISPAKEISSAENARVGVSGVIATLEATDVETSTVTVLDMSTEGIGIMSPVAVERSAEVTLNLEAKGGAITAIGEVRYCRPDPMVESHFRIGIKISMLQRVDQARWNQMLVEAA